MLFITCNVIHNLNHFYFLLVIMYQLPELVLWTICSYINKDIDKLRFIADYGVNSNKRNITIILEDEYDINNPLTIDYLALGYKLKLSRKSNYFDSILNKYRTQIYGCYIYSLNELNKLKTINHNITHLKFNIDFNDMVTCDNLPSDVTHLTFGEFFDQPVDKLPDSITHLTFGEFFDQPVDKLPDSITHLTLGNEFNNSIDNLPDSITHLTLGNEFNKNIDNLPDSITHLTLGNDFDKPINNLPNGIIYLKFGWCFKQHIDKYNLPSNLKYLVLECKSFVSLNNLPESITHLYIEDTYTPHIINNLPYSLSYLKLPSNYDMSLLKIRDIYFTII
jgi:hypothetical protein